MSRQPNDQAAYVTLRGEWAGFDLVKVGSQGPVSYSRDGIVVLSGIITATNPTKLQANWRQEIGSVSLNHKPRRQVPFIAPTSMSRYEGIYQCGTPTYIDETGGGIKIFFTKNTQPLVLHLSGLSFCNLPGDPEEVHLVCKDWGAGGNRQNHGGGFKVDPKFPLGLQRCGNIVFLQGQLLECHFGPTSQLLAQLPEQHRPKRELRCLAALLREEEDFFIYDQTVAVTLHTDGKISVQGGKVHQVDNKGQMRVMQQNKKGRLSLEGVHFCVAEGLPITLAPQVQVAPEKNTEATKSKLSYLTSDGSASKDKPTAVVYRQGDVCVLEGFLSWSAGKASAPHPKKPLAMLPEGHWPKQRECFFTRGGSDLEERRRVDIDIWGRIFCPEGVSDGRVELTGIIFVADTKTPSGKPRDAEDWDDLTLQYQRAEVAVASTSFDGHELLEAFVRRSNWFEWKFLEWDFVRHSGRKMLLPLGTDVTLRGHKVHDPLNLKNDRTRRFWSKYSTALHEVFGITSFYTLLHVTDEFFTKIVGKVNMDGDSVKFLEDYRRKQRLIWQTTRLPGLTFQRLEALASEIADQMFDHWDFKAQLSGALHNDFKPPATIEHLYFHSKRGGNWEIRKNIKQEDMAKFEEIRQFFYLYETTGANMTHCSLMGASDTFSTTGKWHFPDSPEVQKQLFENIEWLFPRKMYMYMSERQTQRFPFIEDFDVQAPQNYEDEEVPADGQRKPPDFLIMTKPQRDGDRVYGDPGEFMKWRARAIHMVYPDIERLVAVVYSASGLNKGKGMLKTSFHLVWPQLIVDPDRAPVIREVTLKIFQDETKKKESYLNKIHRRLLNLHETNSWELVFDSTTINARNGLRLPYSDKASMVIKSEEDKKKVKEGLLSKTKAPKTRVKEERPSKGYGKIEFTFTKDPTTGEETVHAEWIADEHSYRISEWIALGTCRRDPTSAELTELTPWQLTQDVLKMLPTKPGQQFGFAEGEDDGEGGHWVTHKPFPQIRRCGLSVKDFISEFDERLQDEQEELRQEHGLEFRKRVMGTWNYVTENQAIWRAAASSQMSAKYPDHLWHRSSDRWRHRTSNARAPEGLICRPAEIIYLRQKGKVIVDGPEDVVEALLRPLKNMTKPDDNAVMPIYDVSRMTR